MNADRYEWVSVDEASRRLGKSPSTIRRMCEDPDAGLVCEREPRARGDSRERWLVRFDRGITDAPAPLTQSEPQPPPDASGPLTVALETIRDQSARIAELEREAGRLEGQVIAANAERDAARTTASDLGRRLEAAEGERDALKRRGWWDRLRNRW